MDVECGSEKRHYEQIVTLMLKILKILIFKDFYNIYKIKLYIKFYKSS